MSGIPNHLRRQWTLSPVTFLEFLFVCEDLDIVEALAVLSPERGEREGRLFALDVLVELLRVKDCVGSNSEVFGEPPYITTDAAVHDFANFGVLEQKLSH